MSRLTREKGPEDQVLAARRRDAVVTATVLALTAVAFAAVADHSILVHLQRADDAWLRLMISGRAAPVTALAKVFNWLGLVYVTLPVRIAIAGFLALRRRWWHLAAFAAAVLLSEILIGTLKGVYDRARPPGSLVATSGASFPSGHSVAATVTVVAAVIALVPPGRARVAWGAAAAVFAVLMALSVPISGRTGCPMLSRGSFSARRARCWPPGPAVLPLPSPGRRDPADLGRSPAGRRVRHRGDRVPLATRPGRARTRRLRGGAQVITGLVQVACLAGGGRGGRRLPQPAPVPAAGRSGAADGDDPRPRRRGHRGRRGAGDLRRPGPGGSDPAGSRRRCARRACRWSRSARPKSRPGARGRSRRSRRTVGGCSSRPWARTSATPTCCTGRTGRCGCGTSATPGPPRRSSTRSSIRLLAGLMAERAGVSVPGVDRVVRTGDTVLLVMPWADGCSLDRLPVGQMATRQGRNFAARKLLPSVRSSQAWAPSRPRPSRA
jgi:membrane-associated phospholipid phosphatase